MKNRIQDKLFACISAIALMAGSTAPALAQIKSGRGDSAEETRANEQASIPKCGKKLGTAAIMEPEFPWWREYSDLGSPEALIRIFVRESGCFTLVNRGRGMDAMMAERGLASSGELRQGSNLGKGQIMAADYIIVPDIVSQNRNKGGNAIGGLLGGIVGGVAGTIIGGINLKKKSANVILYVTDARSSVEVAASEGQAQKTDLGWGAGGGLFGGGLLGAGGASGYANTEIGQVIALAYLDAYKNMVSELGGLPENASAANVAQAVSMTRSGQMLSAPRGKLVRDLDPGMMLYPTGEKDGVWWEVDDELGNRGWVLSSSFELAK